MSLFNKGCELLLRASQLDGAAPEDPCWLVARNDALVLHLLAITATRGNSYHRCRV